MNKINILKRSADNFTGELLPVRKAGDIGLANVHPEEGDEGNISYNNRNIDGELHIGLDSELMTGWMEDLNTLTPLSKISIGFLDDSNATHPDYDVNDFPAGFLNATNFPGGPGSNYYCIPMSFESYIVFYNKELINKYLDGKLPETMDELIAMAKQVKADSGGDVAGAAMRGLRTDTNIDTNLNFQIQQYLQDKLFYIFLFLKVR